jgi:LAO/AO transport system kinase
LPRNSSGEITLTDKILKGDIRSASKLLTLVENRDPAALPLLKTLYPHTGRADLIGITGPAGAGKSTLINHLITAFRKKKKSVGVLAIDPSSPLTGGAILGDRLRMHPHFLDKGVFIRSLATRGSWGGLSPALFDAIHILDAMGKEIIFIETVGVGQDEVQIARLAETLLLVLSPGIGDEVQILKAGLLEIGDIIAVNKGDLKEAGPLLQELHEMVLERPIIKVAAAKGEGLSALVDELERKSIENKSNRTKKMNFVKAEIEGLLREVLLEGVLSKPIHIREMERVLLRKEDPYSFVRSWMKKRS